MSENAHDTTFSDCAHVNFRTLIFCYSANYRRPPGDRLMKSCGLRKRMNSFVLQRFNGYACGHGATFHYAWQTTNLREPSRSGDEPTRRAERRDGGARSRYNARMD